MPPYRVLRLDRIVQVENDFSTLLTQRGPGSREEQFAAQLYCEGYIGDIVHRRFGGGHKMLLVQLGEFPLTLTPDDLAPRSNQCGILPTVVIRHGRTKKADTGFCRCEFRNMPDAVPQRYRVKP